MSLFAEALRISHLTDTPKPAVKTVWFRMGVQDCRIQIVGSCEPCQDLLLVHDNLGFRTKRELGFGRQRRFLRARGIGTRGACRSSRRRADGCTFASSRDSTDQRANPCASTNQGQVPAIMVLSLHQDGSRGDRNPFAARG